MQSDHLLDKGEVCRYFGGSKPINVATLYRQIRKGRFPKRIRPIAAALRITELREVVSHVTIHRNSHMTNGRVEGKALRMEVEQSRKRFLPGMLGIRHF